MRAINTCAERLRFQIETLRTADIAEVFKSFGFESFIS